MLERHFEELRRQQWFGRPRSDELAWRLRQRHTSRPGLQRAVQWLLLPLLVLSVAATVAGVRQWFTVPLAIELDLDGTIVGAGTTPLLVDESGPYPVRVELPGHGPVDLEVELPPDLPPSALEGRRLHVIFSTDPGGPDRASGATGR
ncbi:MAG: hypothetical protein NXI31_26325 [bacterium]|nr:hypothetical protein [bacterium]